MIKFFIIKLIYQSFFGITGTESHISYANWKPGVDKIKKKKKNSKIGA